MKQLILLLLGLLLLQPATQVFAKDELPFHFTAPVSKKLTSSQLEAAVKNSTVGVIDKAKNTLTFSGEAISIVVRTGPEDDMLSYRIQGLRNPTIVVPEMTSLKVLFVNADEDMFHDFRVGDVKVPFKSKPDTSKTAGSEHLGQVIDGVYNAQEFGYHLHDKGILRYFCSVGSHAKNGMWGTVVVGDGPIPAPDKQMPHKDHGMEGMPGM